MIRFHDERVSKKTYQSMDTCNILTWTILYADHRQWRIQDFLEVDANSGRANLFGIIFAENCMKMKKNWTGSVDTVQVPLTVLSIIHGF